MGTIFSFNDGFSVAAGRHLGGDGACFKPVRIPHDDAIGQRRGALESGQAAQGFVDCYHDLTYRKIFRYHQEVAGERIWLLFDGVYRQIAVKPVALAMGI